MRLRCVGETERRARDEAAYHYSRHFDMGYLAAASFHFAASFASALCRRFVCFFLSMKPDATQMMYRMICLLFLRVRASFDEDDFILPLRVGDKCF